MAANQNLVDRIAALGITGHTVGNKAITFNTSTLSETQLTEMERAADTQGWQRTLAAGVFTLSAR